MRGKEIFKKEENNNGLRRGIEKVQMRYFIS